MSSSLNSEQSTTVVPDPMYVPPEIGSRLARALFRVCELEGELSYLSDAIGERRSALAQLQQQLGPALQLAPGIYQSLGWKLLQRCSRLRGSLLPRGSIRRRVVATLLKGFTRGVTTLFGRSRPASVPGCCPVPPARANDPRQYSPISSTQETYARFIEKNEPGAAGLARQRATRFPREIRISILIIANRSAAEDLSPTLLSVGRQTYPHWEICLAGHKGTAPWMTRAFQDAFIDIPRSKAIARPSEASITELYHTALKAATGEYIILVRPRDVLAPSALFEIAKAFICQEGVDVLYSDEDVLNPAGDDRTNPRFKSDWSSDFLRGADHLGDLVVYSRALLEQLGGFPKDFDGSTNEDLFLSAAEKARTIVHLPHVLYHRRMDQSSSGAAGG